MQQENIKQIIEKLNLVKHCEGGYYHRTYYSDTECINSEDKPRRQMSSIYYLLTKKAPISYFARNKSDLIVFHHLGDPLKIIFLDDDGDVHNEILGPNVVAGQQLQVICPGNTCKAYDLMDGEFALIGEAVAPGFEYEDMNMPTIDEVKHTHPNLTEDYLLPYCHSPPVPDRER